MTPSVFNSEAPVWIAEVTEIFLSKLITPSLLRLQLQIKGRFFIGKFRK